MSEADQKPEGTDQQAPPPVQDTPPPASGGFDLGVVIQQAKQVVTAPVEFYRSMPREGGFSEPVIFAMVMAAAAGAVFAVLSIIGLTGAGFAGIAAIIVMPIGMLIGSFIGAAILFVIWKLMGSPRNFEGAYRSVAYSTAITPILTVFSIIPYLGTIIRVAWSTWLMIIASVEVHERPRQTANIVFGILGALLLVTGLSSEAGQRRMQAVVEDRAEQFRKLGMDEDGEIDPEKAGRAMGDFIRGMQEAAEGAQGGETAKEE